MAIFKFAAQLYSSTLSSQIRGGVWGFREGHAPPEIPTIPPLAYGRAVRKSSLSRCNINPSKEGV
jgi:hypothetical protein